MADFGSKKTSIVDEKLADEHNVISFEAGEVKENADHLHRRLGNRQIQLMSIGGAIGTALFVSIGSGLHRGGPGSLLIAYTLYSCMLALVNNGLAEMTVLFPVSGGFVRLAGKFVDDAFGFMAGWNFFFYEALLIPFEITALDLVLSFWRDDIPTAAVCGACIVLYAWVSLFQCNNSESSTLAQCNNDLDFYPNATRFDYAQRNKAIGLLNVLAVKAFGEAEFWLSGGKVILIGMLFCFTFITMVGGNPQRDAYGFRNWYPTAFAEYSPDGIITNGSLARFEGFLAALWSASFTVVGPEYISMVAAEAKRPRKYIKAAFKTVYWRFGLFFILGALCVGIVIRYNDDTLTKILGGTEGGGGTAAASPYVIAMQNLGIGVFPHIVNALLVTSIFSAGNTYTYCATRSLYALALEGRAPKILRYCTKNGIPILCFAIVMIFPFLSFLQVGNSSSQVLTWLIALITAGGVIDYIIMSTTYIFFYRAIKAQGIDRKTLPYCGWFQPYSAYISLAFMICIVFTYGYSSFKPWSVSTFFSYYTMVIVAPVLFIGWKIIHRTSFVKPHEADLVWERPIVDAYEATFIDEPVGFWTEMVQLVGFKRKAGGNDKRRGSVV